MNKLTKLNKTFKSIFYNRLQRDSFEGEAAYFERYPHLGAFYISDVVSLLLKIIIASHFALLSTQATAK